MHAQTNDADAERYRPELRAHCYRLLGSIDEAEDAVQETLVRAWRGADRFEGRSSLRTWLYRIATNVSLSMLARRDASRRLLPHLVSAPSTAMPDVDVTSDVPWLEPYPDAKLDEIADVAPGPQARYEASEATRLAFVAAIAYLPPRQRAILLLCDVLGWHAAETAQALETSTSAVNSALQRARETLKTKLPRDPAAIPTHLRSAVERRLLERYVRAWESFDLDGVVALLKDEAIFAMPPRPEWYRGRRAIRELLGWAWAQTGFVAARLVPVRANRQPAVALYGKTAQDESWTAHAIHVLTLDADGAIEVVTNYLDRTLFAKFGLPLTL